MKFKNNTNNLKRFTYNAHLSVVMFFHNLITHEVKYIIPHSMWSFKFCVEVFLFVNLIQFMWHSRWARNNLYWKNYLVNSSG